MTENQADDNQRQPTDELVVTLAEYIFAGPAPSALALDTARLCLRDSIGCALEALKHPACMAHLGPLVYGGGMAGGARVLGTGEYLDPVKAAFDNGTLIRWLDFNDTWLAAEWGHPSDNLGGLLAVADYLCRVTHGHGRQVTVGELLRRMVQAYEIQGILALANAFNRVGLDHVLLVKIASAGIVAHMLGGGRAEVESALSHAWIDGHSLRTYRHAPNTSQRKSWAAGDATSRGVRLALMATRAGLPALPTAVSVPRWGFADVLFDGQQPVLARELGSYVMENILFKVSYPAEFHAQTAVECAVRLHAHVRDRLDEITAIELVTQEAAIRIISKHGELNNPADRDHCLQYMVSVGLLEGDLTATHYEDAYAARPEINRLRKLMTVREKKAYSKDYLDADKRSITNAVQVHFADGTSTERIEIEYPLGHLRRRDEALPALADKFKRVASIQLGDLAADHLAMTFEDTALQNMPVDMLLDLTVATTSLAN